jgi:hypothetical protein
MWEPQPLATLKASMACTWITLPLHASYMPKFLFSKVSFYVGPTESHEQHFFACNLGTADEREYGGRWNQLLC